ncbi:calcium-binding protein [Belnapia sp. F-4-1]|uniref:calcium-binding protein n=1 Tax=Belnapia sp. F-4-1 TaxID=1545443 RepID=UPI00068A6D5C|nr:calcium-binding protein [Belnapia sp. F-4-1]
MAMRLGTAADDTLHGTGHLDLVAGRAGNDSLIGGFGDDVLSGGSGNDTIHGENEVGPDPRGYINTAPGEPAAGSNLIFGGTGNDSIIAGFGHDIVSGGAGNDTLSGAGTPSFPYPPLIIEALNFDRGDLLSGGAGNDSIQGFGGRDTIRGGSGDDTVAGGTGVDVLLGGAGHDAFAFSMQSWRPSTSGIDTGIGHGKRDVVLDFRQGEDILDFAGYKAVYGSDLGPTVFHGTGGFVDEDRTQLRYEVQDGRTIVEFYVGDLHDPATPPTAHGQIELVGTYRLSASDFKFDFDLG